MTETAPKPNFAVRCVQKIAGVPKRFTAAFVLILPLFVLHLLPQRFESYCFNHNLDCTQGLFLENPPGPAPEALSPRSTLLAISLFIAAQMALFISFALLKERGAEVSAKKRAALHAAPILLSALFAVALFHQTIFVTMPLLMLVTALVFALALAAVPLIAQGFEEGKKALPAFLGRILLAAVIALLIPFLILVLAAQIGLIRGSTETLMFTLFNTVIFPWLFMAGIPDAPHQTAPILDSPHD